jgi:hypothetical protein
MSVMTDTRVTGVVALLVLFTGVAVAQEDLLDTPRRLEQVTFSPATSASIRLTNGIRRTGKIVSISRESMVYQVGRDNKEVSVEIDEIQRVNSLDGEFTYEPAREDFERLKIKARRISYLSVQTVETYVPPPEGSQEPDPPETSDPATPSDPAPPIVNPEPLPDPAETSPPLEATSPEMSDPETARLTQEPSVEIPDEEPQPGQLILFCSNCNKRLPLSISNGDECPHCGRVLYNLPGRAQSGSRPGPAGASGSPDGGAAAYPEVAGNQAAEGGTVTAAPGNAAAGGGQVSARGFSLSEVPVWMRVGFFIGLLAVGWILLQRR